MPSLTNLRNLLKERGRSEGLSRNTGISSGNISDWKSGRSKPGLESLLKIADYFECSVDYLLDRTNVMAINSNLDIQSSIIYRFPVYEQQAAAGAGKHGREGKYYMKDLQITNLSNHAVFGVEISGNSMEKTDSFDCGIKENATVLLNPNFDELDLDGRVVVFKINSTNEVLCKRYFKEENTIGFISDNDECSDMNKHLTTGEYTIIGEVVNIINP